MTRRWGRYTIWVIRWRGRRQQRSFRWLVLWVFTATRTTGALVLVGWAVWRIPQALYVYVPELRDRASVEASTRTGMIAGLAGLAALGSLALTTRTYRLTQQGQLTDRYTKAIAQLGDDKLDVRLGGIYALERIAVDSKRDHATVVEVLSAYVRERSAPVHMYRPASRRTAHPPNLHKKVKLGVDVQAALTVLGRLPRRAGVSRTDLREANLDGADFTWADLTWANLRGANLTGANLYAADLTGADLDGADLTGADLDGADLTGADLHFAKLTIADLSMANLTAANLTAANLNAADLTEAHLGRANLTEANLDAADLAGADLGGADLTGTRWKLLDLNSAFGDESTKLPAGLRRPEGWHR